MIKNIIGLWNSWLDLYEEYCQEMPWHIFPTSYPWIVYVNPEWFDIKNQDLGDK